MCPSTSRPTCSGPGHVTQLFCCFYRGGWALGTPNITLMTNFREYEDNQKTVESGVKTDLDDEMIASSGKAVRDPKFMVYWLTTTK